MHLSRFHLLLPLLPGLVALMLAVPGGVPTQEEQDGTPPGMPEHLETGERLRISVLGLAGPGIESRFVRRIDARGQVELPVIGRVPAADLPRPEVEERITGAYNRSTVRTRPLVVISRLDHGEDHHLIPPLETYVAD